MRTSLPPEILAINLLVCRRILHEVDGVSSAIRIVDVFYVGELPPEIRNFETVPVVQAHGLIQIKCEAGYNHPHQLNVTIIDPAGEESAIIPRPFTTNFESRMGPEVPGGTTINLQLNIAVKRFGTFYLCLYFDGELMAKSPITILLPERTATE